MQLDSMRSVGRGALGEHTASSDVDGRRPLHRPTIKAQPAAKELAGANTHLVRRRRKALCCMQHATEDVANEAGEAEPPPAAVGGVVEPESGAGSGPG